MIAVGYFWFSFIFITTVSGFRVYLWSRLWKTNFRKVYGEWVVITGATDGIGLEYAKEFADRGHSLILIGRNPDKLDSVKRLLTTKTSPDKVVTIVADFHSRDPEVSLLSYY